jgi:hypothetical protein
MNENGKSELEIWLALARLAEERFGKERAGEIRMDIEQMGSELCVIGAFPLRPDDEA